MTSSTIIHPEVNSSGDFVANKLVVMEIEDDNTFREYVMDSLNQPLGRLRDKRRDDRAKLHFPSGGGGTPMPGLPSLSPSGLFCTTFYDEQNYGAGKSLTLCNYTSSLEAEFKLSDNQLNDKISSIKVGSAIACVLCCQHTYFRGKRLWLIGGEHPSQKDLSNVAFPGGVPGTIASLRV